jgi:hypothetical protein
VIHYALIKDRKPPLNDALGVFRRNKKSKVFRKLDIYIKTKDDTTRDI